MAKGYKETEYMYSSARIRALETKLIGGDEILRFADAQDTQSIISSLDSYGFELSYTKDGDFSREDTLMSVLYRGFSEILGMECASAVKFLQYQYDCNNIKAIIKCSARGIAFDDMLMPIGSVSVDDAKKAFSDKNYSKYPEAMAKAIAEAEEAFAATANPQKIDFIIDRACFEDMKKAAENTKIPLARKLAVAKIDLVNIMQTLRILRMKLGNGAEAMLREVYIEGGTLDMMSLVKAIEDTDEFIRELRRSEYYKLADLIEADVSLGEIERKVDGIYFGIAKEAKWVPFGAEIAIGYIFALEYEIKNLRLVLAGKEAGLSPETIKERLRESYV